MLLELAVCSSDSCDTSPAAPTTVSQTPNPTPAITEATNQLVWYVLSEDPEEYRAILEDILALTELAKDEAALRLGMRHVLGYQPWIHPTQVDVDMRQCHPGFEQEVDTDWRTAHQHGLEAVMAKL